MSIIIREAQRSDVPAVAELFDLYRQFYEQPADGFLAREFIAARLGNEDSVILVAESAPPGLVGFCQLYPTFCSVEARPIYILHDLFVLPIARKSGVGRMLLQAAEAKAVREGKARMDLTTARTNIPAHVLYESLGWVRNDTFVAYTHRVNQ